MNISKKRIIVNLLIIAMVLTMMPSMAFAQSDENVNAYGNNDNNVVIENTTEEAIGNDDQSVIEEQEQNNSDNIEPEETPKNTTESTIDVPKPKPKSGVSTMAAGDVETIDVSTLAVLKAELKKARQNDVVINITDNIKINESLVVSPGDVRNIKIKSTGNKTLTRTKPTTGSAGSMFQYDDVGTFVIQDVILDGGGKSNVIAGTALINIGKGKLIISSGTEIRDCKSTGYGSVIMNRGGTIQIEGGVIKDSMSPYGPIYSSYGKVLIFGGKITNNTSTGKGGGVHINAGSLEISGGEISQNKATSNGDGIYLNQGNESTPMLKLKGKPAIKDLIYSTKKMVESIQITGNLTGTELIRIDPSALVSEVDLGAEVAKKTSGTLTENEANLFVSRDYMLQGKVKNSTTVHWGWSNKTLRQIHNFNELKLCLEHGFDTDTVFDIVEDIELTGAIVPYNQPNKKILLTSSYGKQIKRSKTLGSEPIRISSGVNLTIDSLVLDGNNPTQVVPTKSLLKIESGGELTLNGGTVLRNNKSNENGGAINMTGGKLTINGGQITNNISAGSSTAGGGIYASGSSQIIMNGGQIDHNSSTSSNGGGINLTNSSSLEMNGGQIDNNTCKSNGGGVYLTTTAKLILDGGRINSNTSTNGAGGGVYASSSTTVQMRSGSISNNTASLQGGGMFLTGSVTSTISSGTISNNRSDSNGGGIAVTGSSKLTNTGGNITNNHSANYGGGLRIETDKTVELKGGSVKNNTAGLGGGGISILRPSNNTLKTVEISGGTIGANKAKKGSGIDSDYGRIYISGGEINNPKTDGNMEKLFNLNNSNLYLSGIPKIIDPIYTSKTLSQSIYLSGDLFPHASTPFVIDENVAAAEFALNKVVATKSSGDVTAHEADLFICESKNLIGTNDGKSVKWRYIKDISFSQTHVKFPSRDYRENVPDKERIMVKNEGARSTGTLLLAIDSEGGKAFTLSKFSMSIAAGGQNYFEIQPKSSPLLQPGKYTATVTVGNDEIKDKKVTFEYTVNDLYEIELNQQNADFGSITYKDPQPGPITIRVKNKSTTSTGDMQITLSDKINFEVNKTTMKIAATNGEDTFTIKPKTGMIPVPGTYNTTVTIGNTNVPSQKVTVTFKVNHLYEITPITTSVDFESKVYGSVSPAKNITVKNSGTIAVNNVTATLEGTNAGSFTIVSKPSSSTISKDATAIYSVQPKNPIEPGTYKANLVVKGTNTKTVTIPLNYTVEHLYKIKVDESVIFDAKQHGYEQPIGRNVNVKNMGTTSTGAMTISLDNDDAFAIDKSTMAINNANETGTFKVTPKTGLSPGTHKAVVTIGNSNMEYEKVNVSFTVGDVHDIVLSEKTLDFNSITVNGTLPEEKELEIRNIGTTATGDINITLGGISPGAFTVSPESIGSIAQYGTKVLKIQPKDKLTPGTYEADLSFGNSNIETKTAKLKFTVNDLYKITLNKDKVLFNTITYGDNQPGWEQVTVNNMGTSSTGDVHVALDDMAYFELDKNIIKIDNPQGNASFGIKPKDGLAPGEYETKVIVGNDKMDKQVIDVSFKVDHLYKLTLNPTVISFGSITYNDPQPQAKTVTVKNVGTDATGDITPKIEGAGSSAFKVTSTKVNIGAGKTNVFAVQINGKPAPGQYKAKLVLKSDKIETSIDLNYNVDHFYSISYEKVDFGSIKYKEDQPGWKEVVVTNKGTTSTGRIDLHLIDQTNFEINKSVLDIENANGTDSFMIRPKAGLNPGQYTTSVTAYNSKLGTRSIDVNFEVEHIYGISTETSELDFSYINYGQPNPDPRKVEIVNEGTTSTGIMDVKLTGTSPEAFTISKDEMTIKKPNETGSVYVGIADDLDPEQYKATLSIGNAVVGYRTVKLAIVIGGEKNAPRITKVTPSGEADNIAGDVEITFDQIMDKTTYGVVTINDEPLTEKGVWSADNIYTIPYKDLDYDTEYSIAMDGFKSAKALKYVPIKTYSFKTQPKYEIYLSETETLALPNTDEGYDNTKLVQNIDVSISGKTSSLYVSLEGGGKDNFLVTPNMLTLDEGETKNITITPVKGLLEGEYNATLKITDGREITKELGIKFIVNDAKFYAVTFDYQGGSVPVAKRNVKANRVIGDLPDTTKIGYRFDGWYTMAMGGERVDKNHTVKGDITLFAHWTANVYTLSYNTAGGKISSANKSVSYGSDYGALPTPTKKNNKFLGWYTAAKGGSKVAATTKHTITGNTTIYARWEAAKKVTFVGNKGKIKKKKTKVVYKYNKTKIGKLPKATRKGYKFKGWYTKKKGGKKIKSNKKITKNMKVYAQWKKK